MYLYDENDAEKQLVKVFDDHFGEIVAIDCLEQGDDYVVVSMHEVCDVDHCWVNSG